MNAQNFTQKSIEAINNAQKLAIEYQNPQVEVEHILLALLDQDNSLVKELIKKMGVIENFEKDIKRRIENMPRVTGGARPSNGIYVSQDVDIVLQNSENIAKKMKDEYVSVEHIMLAIIDNVSGELKEIFKK